MALVSGNGQIVPDQFLAKAPMVIQVTDASGHPAAAVPVTWSVVPLIGTITAFSSKTTDANGLAHAIFLGSLQPGNTQEFTTITASTPLGSASFVATVVASRQGTGLAPLPAAELVSPPADNRRVSGRAGSTLPGAIVVRVIAQTGFQTGLVPGVGIRIVDSPQDPNSNDPPPPSAVASCAGYIGGVVLTDDMGTVHCDLVLSSTPGIYALTALAGEAQNTPVFILEITPGPTCTYSLTPTSQSAQAAGGTGTIAINTTAGCGWTATSNAPWITINGAANGIGNGSVAISIAANSLTDPRSGTVTIAGQTYTVNQSGTSGTTALAITTPANLPSANLNVVYTSTLMANGGTSPYTWSSTGSLPPGITLNAGSGVLSGTPTAAGVFNFNVMVSDHAVTPATVSQSFSLAVNSNGGGGVFTITTASVAPGVIGTSYQQTLATSGGCPPNPFAQIIVAITAGSFPPGLSLGLTAQGAYAIVGTPTIAGTSNFTITATEPCGTKATASFALTVTASAPAGPNLVASPAALTFNTQAGSSTAPNTQTITITSTGVPLAFALTSSTSSGGNWLTVTPSGGTSPISLNIGVANFASLNPGTYNGSIVVTSAQAANSPLTIPIALTVSASLPVSVAINPQSLIFNYIIGSNSFPGPQTLQATTTGASAHLGVSASTFIAPTWLAVSPPIADTPAALTVTVSTGGLTVGTYNGLVLISVQGSGPSTQTIPVTLNILPPPTVTATPQNVAFSAQAGTTTGSQTVSIASSAAVRVAVSAATTSGGNWLTYTPSGGTTPLNVNIGTNTAGLAAGTYSGTVTISSEDTGQPVVAIAVTLTVTSGPPVVLSIANAASFALGPIAPGEVVTLFGTAMGPANVVLTAITGGFLDTKTAGTRVLFDGIAAPLIYVSATQISAIVPYEVFGRVSTSLQVEAQGVLSPAILLRVVDTVPGIFVIDTNGQGAVLNQDTTVNSTSNPAAQNTVIVIYATGEGATDRTVPDGKITSDPLSTIARPKLPVIVTIGGLNADILYAGAAPGLPAGILQVNARVPTGLSTDVKQSLVVKVGGVPSQAGVFVAVKK